MKYTYYRIFKHYWNILNLLIFFFQSSKTIETIGSSQTTQNWAAGGEGHFSPTDHRESTPELPMSKLYFIYHFSPLNPKTFWMIHFPLNYFNNCSSTAKGSFQLIGVIVFQLISSVFPHIPLPSAKYADCPRKTFCPALPGVRHCRKAGFGEAGAWQSSGWARSSSSILANFPFSVNIRAMTTTVRGISLFIKYGC